MRSLHVSRSLGPSLQYALDAVVPDLKPEDVIGKGQRLSAQCLVIRVATLSAYAEELEGPDKDAAWRELAPHEAGPIRVGVGRPLRG